MEDKLKIVIADSQFLVIESLEHLIEEENKYVLCGIVDSRYFLLKLLQLNTPDLLITDINLIDYESLGGVESLICYPSTMTHGSIPGEQRNAIEVTKDLIRLSVGIEDVEDLIEDLSRG